MIRIIIFITLFSFSLNILYSQEENSYKKIFTQIDGIVVDSETGEPLPFVNIYFSGTTVGTLTDNQGKFSLNTLWAKEYIEASFMGYSTKKEKIKIGESQKLKIKLKQIGLDLKLVTVSAKKRVKRKENPAIPIIMRTINNRKNASISNLNAYQYDRYEKLDFFVTNVTEKAKEKGILKDFPIIFNYVDTNEYTGKPEIPILLNEKNYEIKYKKSPYKFKENLMAERYNGFKYKNINFFLENLYNDFDINTGHIRLLGVDFINPISNIGQIYYRYLLIDSLKIDGEDCYKILFNPSRTGDLAFRGEVYIIKDKYVVKRIKMDVNDKVNVNFVNQLIVEKTYTLIEDSILRVDYENIIGDFSLTEQLAGLSGKRFVKYNNFIANKILDENEYKDEKDLKTEFELKQDTTYWKDIRPSVVRVYSKDAKVMIDSLHKMKLFNTYQDIVRVIYNGHVETKYIDIGNFFHFLSYNSLEGIRLKFSFRTTENLFKRLQISPFIAFGTSDLNFKGGSKLFYVFNRKKWNFIETEYNYDYYRLGQANKRYPKDHIFNTFVRGFKLYDIPEHTKIENFAIKYGRNIFKDFNFTVGYNFADLSPVGGKYFYYLPNYQNDILTLDANGNITRSTENILKGFKTSDFSFSLTWSHRKEELIETFTRTITNPFYPILKFKINAGIKDFLGGNYDYQKLEFELTHSLRASSLGYMDIIANVSKTFGRVPYSILEILASNETFVSDDRGYNLMANYEYIGDFQANIFATHHFMGFFLNKIPFLKKAKLREVVFGKFAWCALSDENDNTKGKYRDLPLFPAKSKQIGLLPYTEIGIGIENILKFFRVDAVWRLTYPSTIPENNFIINFRFGFYF